MGARFFKRCKLKVETYPKQEGKKGEKFSKYEQSIDAGDNCTANTIIFHINVIGKGATRMPVNKVGQ